MKPMPPPPLITFQTKVTCIQDFAKHQALLIRDALCTYKWFGKCTWRVVCCRSRSLPQVQSSMSLFRPPRMVPTPRLCGLHPGLLRQLIAASGNVTSSHPHNNTSSQQSITTTIHHKNSDPLVADVGNFVCAMGAALF